MLSDMKDHLILQWISIIISALNVIFKDIQTGSSLLEHGGHIRSMWAECTGFLMRSRDSLLWRIKNCFNTSFHYVFSGRIWPIQQVRGTSAKYVEQIIWHIRRPCFHSHASMEVNWDVQQLLDRVRFMVPWRCQLFEISYCCTVCTASMMPDETFPNLSWVRNSLDFDVFYLSNTAAFKNNITERKICVCATFGILDTGLRQRVFVV